MAYTFPETGHHLLIGTRVPDAGVGLCYLGYPPITPESCLAIMNTGDDIPGNEDDPVAGTRQIRVDGMYVGASDAWWPAITPGAFYVAETLSADSPALPAWAAGLGGDGVTLYWEYSLGLPHGQQQFASLATTPRTSDPTVIVGDPTHYSATGCVLTTTESPRPVGGGLYAVQATPLHISDTHVPMITPLVDGVAAGEAIPCVVVDAQRGLIRPVVPPPDGVALACTYLGTQSRYIFAGYRDTAFCALDLNPMPGHFCLTPGEALFTVTTTTGAMVTTTAGDVVTVRSSSSLYAYDTRELLAGDGVQLYLYPSRCWYTAGSGAGVGRVNTGELLTWSTGASPQPDPSLRAHVLARIYTRPPLVIGHVQVFDARVRGGGLAVTADPARYPEARTYFDVTHIDGEPSMEHGVAVIRATRNLVRRVGETAILRAAEKALAAGVAPILEIIEE